MEDIIEQVIIISFLIADNCENLVAYLDSITKIEKYNPKFSIRLSMKNLSLDNNIVNIPLFMIEYLPKFLNNLLEEENDKY